MATSSNLVKFDEYFPFHNTKTETALSTLRNCIGYDPNWDNDFGVAVPITIPKNYKVSSISFTISLKRYRTSGHYKAPQDDWKIWISDTKYETTSEGKKFSTVSSNTPHHTLTIPYYESGSSETTRTITFSNNLFNWTEDTTYYIYLWNECSPRQYCMWRVTDWTGIATYVSNYSISYNANGADTGTAPSSQTKTHDVALKLQDKGTLNHVGEELNATYIVTIDANGGTNCNNLTSKKWKYWILDGWNTAANGTGTDYDFGGTYTANSSATMYVKWGIHYRTESIIFPETSRTGYTFGGWKIGNNTYNIGDSYTPSSSVTAIAQWSSTQHKVIFDGNGGTPSKKEINVNHGLTYGALPSASRTGYTFNGWFTAQSGGTEITSTTVVSITENQTLYAQWTAFKYKVKYEINGGNTTSKLEMTATYDTSFNLISNISKDTFDFKGWNTRSDGSGTNYSAGQSVTNLTTVKDGVVTLYAIWETSPYEVTYNVYGNKYIQENVKNDSDLLSINEVLSKLKIKLNNWDKFDSWIATGNGFTDLIININDNVDDLTKVAVKNENPRTVTLRANIKPRFKIVYYNSKGWNRLSAIRYDETNKIWKKITPNINK